MVQGSILSPHTPYIIYYIYIYTTTTLYPISQPYPLWFCFVVGMRRYSISILLFTFSLAFILCLVWCEDRIVYSFMPFSFESMYRLVWGGIGISIHVFSLWFYVLFCVRIDRYIYLPPWTTPLFGARVYHMVQISHRSPIKQNTHFV